MVFSAIRMSVSNFNTLVKIALVFELVAPPGQSEAWRPSQELFGATGSSILLPGFSAEDFKNVQYVNWAFSGTPILDYYNVTQIPTFTNLYKNRCSFFSSNGSLLLKNVTSDDRGLYKVKINLNESRSNVIKLNVIEPLSKPSIFSNSNYVDTTIELICQVSAGKASSILWWKGDAVITNGQHYQLAQSNSTVTISKAIKSDCGNYTCKMENFVSKNQTSYLLAIYGLPPLHHCIVGLSITALISAAAVIIGIIILCLHQDSQTISLKFQNNMLLFLQIAAMVSVAILLAAFVCWIKAEACRVTLDTVTPLDGIIVTCASSILIAEIIKQADKGCEPAPKLQSSIIPAVVVPLVILVAVFATYITCYRKQRRKQKRSPCAGQSEENLDQSQKPEEEPLQAASGEDVSTVRNPVNGEESCQV
ncbi:carcinoembryonic antigen-related cell adhesion molecule 2-like isoform X4 [Heterodontus francisci]|uniref:carcinoembryonic antigen-related cell adhesion molecule 2-like isoform X4 n=1 Tax=Heterodontus francisci TaxID=7792 RepID=UPI00355B5166